MIRFTVPSLRGQGRPRFSKCSGAYKDKKDIEYEKLIRECFLKKAKDFKPSERPVEINIIANYRLAKNTPKYIREAIEGDFSYAPQSKPDIDNVAKSVLDALNGVAYVDDKQVYSLTCDKFFNVISNTDYLEVKVIYDDYTKTIEDIKNERRRH